MSQDLNNDIVIDEKDIELEMEKKKRYHQRRLAWTAMGAMLVTTALILSPVIPVEKITALESVFSTFYFALASVVGAFMGFDAWMSKK